MKTMSLSFCLMMFFLVGCAFRPQEFGQAPRLSPVGSGLVTQNTQSTSLDQTLPTEGTRGRLDLFRDHRAHKVGDTLTVKISINDKATLDNQSGRSRDSKISGDLSFKGALLGAAGEGSADWGTDSKSTQNGKGNVARSESINLSVAAVVTHILPNGNLIIQGSQEVRVNFELRELHVAGIVHPQDVAGDNTISYERIAEARIAYGGRGRLTEAQQPNWGQALYDQFSPF